MNRGLARSALAVPLVVALSACGSAPSHGAANASAMPSHSASPGVSVDQARRMYKQIVAPADVAVGAVARALRRGSVAAIVAACSAAVAPLSNMEAGLSASQWPENVQGQMTYVVAIAASIHTDLEECATERNDAAALDTTIVQLATDALEELAATRVIRIDLGVPDDGGNVTEA